MPAVSTAKITTRSNQGSFAAKPRRRNVSKCRLASHTADARKNDERMAANERSEIEEATFNDYESEVIQNTLHNDAGRPPFQSTQLTFIYPFKRAFETVWFSSCLVSTGSGAIGRMLQNTTVRGRSSYRVMLEVDGQLASTLR